MKEKPWFDEETGKRRGSTISMSLTDDADFEKGMRRVKQLLKPPFEEWLTELYGIIEKDPDYGSSDKYCDDDAWRGHYEDGMTPSEAWASEKSYWSE